MSSLKYLYKSGILKDFRESDFAGIDRTLKALQGTGMIVLLEKPQERSPSERKRKRSMSVKKQTEFERRHKWVVEMLDKLESSHPPEKPQN